MPDTTNAKDCLELPPTNFSILIISYYFIVLDILLNTVKPVLNGHRIKRTPSIKRTVAEVPKFISLIYFK